MMKSNPLNEWYRVIKSRYIHLLTIKENVNVRRYGTIPTLHSFETFEEDNNLNLHKCLIQKKN